MTETLKIKTIALAAAAMLVLPSAAFANSTQEGYGGPNNVVAGLEDTGGGPGPNSGEETPPPVVNSVSETSPEGAAAPASTSGTLPFTGADLGILALIGALMLAFGFGLRHVTRHQSQP